eukprot:1751660-Lingulodinium_polyedra.AAC.1
MEWEYLVADLDEFAGKCFHHAQSAGNFPVRPRVIDRRSSRKPECLSHLLSGTLATITRLRELNST